MQRWKEKNAGERGEKKEGEDSRFIDPYFLARAQCFQIVERGSHVDKKERPQEAGNLEEHRVRAKGASLISLARRIQKSMPRAARRTQVEVQPLKKKVLGLGRGEKEQPKLEKSGG